MVRHGNLCRFSDFSFGIQKKKKPLFFCSMYLKEALFYWLNINFKHPDSATVQWMTTVRVDAISMRYSNYYCFVSDKVVSNGVFGLQCEKMKKQHTRQFHCVPYPSRTERAFGRNLPTATTFWHSIPSVVLRPATSFRTRTFVDTVCVPMVCTV